MNQIMMTPIGVVKSTRKQVSDDHWDAEKNWIELDRTQFSAEALAGLSDFSHVEVFFFMDQVVPSKVEGSALHLEGLDAVEGTPVLDIKPWVAEFAPRGAIFQPAWITELMKSYWS
jgi:tRNA (adenine37-N6)-methyltransferase